MSEPTTMTKDVRQSIVELLMVEKIPIRKMVSRLLEEHGVTVSHETIRKDILEIKGQLDAKRPGWDELSEEDLLRETIRRGFDPKNKTVSVKDALAARKNLSELTAAADLQLSELPEHPGEYPLSPAAIALAHMSNEQLIEKLQENIEAVRKLPE